MTAWIEELTKANEAYFVTRRSALRHSPAGHGRSWGIRRDKVQARASRELRASRRKLGIRPR